MVDAIESAIKALTSKFGKGYIGFGTEVLDKEYRRNSCGIFALDFNCGGGLVVAKKIITIAGDESSGKTATCLISVGAVQKQGGNCAWLDVEHSFDQQWAAKLGVDVSKLVIAQPKSIEEASDTIETLIMSGAFDLIVLDSVASAPSDKELEDSSEQKSMGGIAKPVGLMMKKITARLNDISNPVKTSVFLINQIREKVGITFGNPSYMPCGKALRFHSDVIIWLRPDNKPVGGKDEAQGIRINFIFKKNRTYPPFKTGTYDLLFWEGRVDNQKSLLKAGVSTGVIIQSGYNFTYKDKSASDEKSMLALLSGRGGFSKSNLKNIHNQTEKLLPLLLNTKAMIVEKSSKFYPTNITTLKEDLDSIKEEILKVIPTWQEENTLKLVEYFKSLKRDDWDTLKSEIIEKDKENTKNGVLPVGVSKAKSEVNMEQLFTDVTVTSD